MQLSVAFVAGLLSASLAAAAPADLPKGIKVQMKRAPEHPLHVRGTTTNQIDWARVNKHLAGVKAKYSRSLENYRTNTGKVNRFAKAPSSKKRDTGSVSLTDQEQESLWTGGITFGSSDLTVDFDTGSADCLVNSGTYSPGSSSTKTSKTFSTSYGDGTTASGTVYTDDLSIGGLSDSGVAIGLATSQFLDSSEGSDGICGLSYPALAQFGSDYPPFFDSLMNDGVVSEGAFGFKLAKSGSELYLGGADSSLYSGDITYADVTDDSGFWGVDSTIAGVSAESIIDTGTTVIVADPDIASDIYDAVGCTKFTQDGSDYCSYDCSSPPEVTFKFGSKSITLSDDTTSFGTTDNGDCVLSIVSEDVGISGVIAGDSLIRNAYVVFNRDQNAVGFADLS